MKTYVFIIGTQPTLSLAELIAVIPVLNIITAGDGFVVVQADIPDPEKLLQRLGGTIKIAEVLAEEVSQEAIVKDLQENHTGGKCNFGISFYASRVTKMGFEIKKALTQTGMSVRLVVGKTPILSSVIVTKNKCQEFLILQNRWVAKTLAVQDFEAYGQRDFGRPVRDMKSGSLPPKLAQIMINLAGQPLDAHLLDPFCGSGTVLQEALLMGYAHLTGSDASPRAIADTKTNVTWLSQQAHCAIDEVNIFQQDVRMLQKRLPAASVDAVVTEPYLGPALRGAESLQQLQHIVAELDQLYQAALTALHQVLKPGGIIVMVVPQFRQQKNTLTLPSFFNHAQRLGLQKTSSNDWIYARADQRVRRQIVVLKK